jgi:hypothetical protein
LRLPLWPLTLGHVALLHEIESPVTEPGERIEFPDCLLAVLICSRPHQAARRLIQSKVRLTVAGWRLGFRARGLKLKTEVPKFLEYLEDSYARPELVKPKGKESRTMGAPIEWLLLDALMGDYQMTLEAAYSVPIILAQCLWVTRGDRDQRLQLAGESGGHSPEALVHALYQRQRKLANTEAN